MKVEVENKILKISYLILNYTSVLVITIMGGGVGYIYPLITRILNVLHIEGELYAKHKIHL